MVKLTLANLGAVLGWSYIFFAAVLAIGFIFALPSIIVRKKKKSSVEISGGAWKWSIVAVLALMTTAGVLDTYNLWQSPKSFTCNIFVFKVPEVFLEDPSQMIIGLFSITATVLLSIFLVNVFVLSLDKVSKVLAVGVAFAAVIHGVITLLDHVLSLFVLNFDVIAIVSLCIGVLLSAIIFGKIGRKN